MDGGGAVGVGSNDAIGATLAGGGGGARCCGWLACNPGAAPGCICIGDGTIMAGITGAICVGGGAMADADAPYADCIGGGAPMLPAATCAATLYAAVIDGGTAVWLGCAGPAP